jgi:hypothetical protein
MATKNDDEASSMPAAAQILFRLTLPVQAVVKPGG